MVRINILTNLFHIYIYAYTCATCEVYFLSWITLERSLKAMDLETSMFLYQGLHQCYALPVWGVRLRALLTLNVQ